MTAKTKCHLFQASRKVNNNMDIRDFLTKIDAIQNKEQMKEDVKKIHLNEASQVMLYGDTPEDMNAIAQIFKNAGVTPPAPVEGPKPEEAEAEEVSATEEVPGKANTTPKPEYKDTGYMQKDIAGGINKPKKKCTEKIIQVTIQWLLRQKKKLILSKKNCKKHTKTSKKKTSRTSTYQARKE